MAVVCTEDGRYTVTVGGEGWMKSGPTYFTANGKRYNNMDGSLKLVKTMDIAGEDDVGPWKGVAFQYMAGSTSVVASIRGYTNVAAIVFAQVGYSLIM